MRSNDEKKNVKYLLRIFGWGKHYAIWRRTWKTVLNRATLINPDCAHFPFALRTLCQRRSIAGDKKLCSHRCSFSVKYIGYNSLGPIITGEERKQKQRRERKINHWFDEWATSFPTCPGFPFSHRKALYSVANSGALSLMSITLMATIALDIWLWFPNTQNRNHKKGRDKER